MSSAVTPPNWPPDWPWRPDVEPVRASDAMVVTTDPHASEVGVEVLRMGGNAVDAAVAVSFALAVVNPEAGNIGGGGFLLVHPAEGPSAALDFRSTAPAASSRDLFLDAEGEVGEDSVIGHRAVAVPGSVRGLGEVHGRFGHLSWAELVDPAVSLAGGFTVGARFLRSFEPEIIEGLRRYPSTADVFLPGGEPPAAGGVFRQPDLARTLARIRDHGADEFYLGETATLLVDEMERGGGVVTRDDLAAYTPVWREPLRFSYRDHTVVSMPPSSSGGIALAQTAHLLAALESASPSRENLGDLPWHGPRHVHLLAEVWRRAYADRNHHLADPDFVDIPLETLLSRGYARWRARGIAQGRATPSQGVGPGVAGYRAAPATEKEATTHYSVVDREGTGVSVTTTLNTWYGSKVTVGGAGFLLNNEMDDLTILPGVPNYFGLVQGEANAVEPGKRPLSAMTPTVVLDAEGRLRMVLGTPGGATIITTVFQILSNVLDHGMGLAQAVVAPRVHHQHLPDRIEIEPRALPTDVVEALREMGHEVEERDRMSGDAQAILLRADGTLEGRSDPRRGGTAAGL